MNEAFTAMIALQEEALRLQRMQIDAALAWGDTARRAVEMQTQALGASKASIKAWDAMLGFWGMKR